MLEKRAAAEHQASGMMAAHGCSAWNESTALAHWTPLHSPKALHAAAWAGPAPVWARPLVRHACSPRRTGGPAAGLRLPGLDPPPAPRAASCRQGNSQAHFAVKSLLHRCCEWSRWTAPVCRGPLASLTARVLVAGQAQHARQRRVTAASASPPAPEAPLGVRRLESMERQRKAQLLPLVILSLRKGTKRESGLRCCYLQSAAKSVVKQTAAHISRQHSTPHLHGPQQCRQFGAALLCEGRLHSNHPPAQLLELLGQLAHHISEQGGRGAAGAK